MYILFGQITNDQIMKYNLILRIRIMMMTTTMENELNIEMSKGKKV